MFLPQETAFDLQGFLQERLTFLEAPEFQEMQGEYTAGLLNQGSAAANWINSLARYSSSCSMVTTKISLVF